MSVEIGSQHALQAETVFDDDGVCDRECRQSHGLLPRERFDAVLAAEHARPAPVDSESPTAPSKRAPSDRCLAR